MATRVNNVGVGRYETRQPSRRRPWPADAHPVDAPADPVIVLGLDAATRRLQHPFDGFQERRSC